MNILAECTLYPIDILKLSEKTREELEKEYSIDSDCTSILINGNDVEKLSIPEEAIDYDGVEFDSDTLEDVMTSYLGKHPYYLVFGQGMRYNGASGYKIVSNIIETCTRDYDISLSIVEDLGNDTIICIESSHDVPTGHKTIMIGLTNEEADGLEEYDFNEVEEFVNKRISK